MKTAILVAAVAALVAIAGCGGSDSSDSNQALSYDDFGAAVEKECVQATADITEVRNQFTGDPEHDVPLVQQTIDIAQASIDDVAALDPPAELQEAFDDYSRTSQQFVDGMQDAKKAAEADDAAEYQRILEDLNGVSTENDLAASKLGAGACLAD
jgi:hypothetical protein